MRSTNTSKGSMGSPSLVLVVLLVLIVGAWLMPAAAETDGPTYRRPLGNDPATLDPARISDVYGRSVAQQLFDGLVEFDNTLSIRPGLARFWKSSRDGLTWTFVLRSGVKFHHGREATADDVIYSFTRLLAPSTRSPASELMENVKGARAFRKRQVGHVSGLVAIDKYTVQITLEEAAAPFVALLAVGPTKIVPRDRVEQLGDRFGLTPVGTGPFRLQRWDRGKEIRLEANPEYFDGPPKLSRLIYRIFPGAALDAMYEEFQHGKLEDSPVPDRDYRRVSAVDGYLYVKRSMFSHRHYGFNTQVKPTVDRRLRQAIVYAIDRNAIIEEVFLGRHTPARGILPPGTLGYNPSVHGYDYDPSRARELLAEAGYSDGAGLPTIPIWSSVRHAGILKEHERVRTYLAAIGIRAEFHYLLEWPRFFEMLGERKFPIFLHAWFADVPDPDNFLFKLFHSQSSRNFFGYANAVVDDLLVRARREQDVQRRVELYRRAEQLILDDAPIIPFWHYTYERLFQPYVRSVEVSGLGDPYIPLRKIWLDRKR